MQVLEKNPMAWKDCARWRYFAATLVLYSLKRMLNLVRSWSDKNNIEE